MSFTQIAEATQEVAEVQTDESLPVTDDAIDNGLESTTEAPVSFERPEWLNDDFSGDTLEDATSQQAQAYNDMKGKLGEFAGAPEQYEAFAFSDELSQTMSDRGISMLDASDPLLVGMGDMAKEMNMSQAGYNKFAEAYVSNQIVQEDARVAGVIENLGENAQSRIKEIQAWQSGLPDNIAELTTAVATDIEGIELLEYFMEKSNSSPKMTKVSGDEVVTDPRATLDSLVSDPRYKTDVNYRAEVERKASKLFPSSM